MVMDSLIVIVIFASEKLTKILKINKKTYIDSTASHHVPVNFIEFLPHYLAKCALLKPQWLLLSCSNT